MRRLAITFLALLAVPAVCLSQEAPEAAGAAKPPVLDLTGPILGAIPEFLHTVFIKLWFCWPIIIGLAFLQRLVNGPRRVRRR